MAVDFDLEAAVSRWHSRALSVNPRTRPKAPGLTLSELEELEEACGFSWHPSVRTLFSTTSEIGGPFPIRGMTLSPARLCPSRVDSVEDSVRRSYWKELKRGVSPEDVQLSRAHIPEELCLVFDGTAGAYYVDCGDTNSGAVFTSSEAIVGWAAPSLEQIFLRADELFELDLLGDSDFADPLRPSIPKIEQHLTSEYAVTEAPVLHYWSDRIASLACDIDQAQPVVSDHVLCWTSSYGDTSTES